MRRFPHTATLLRPSSVTDGYGDATDGPLAPVGEPLAAWLQQVASAEDGNVLSVASVLFLRLPHPAVEEDDVVEVDGVRYRVNGEPYTPSNPRGRKRYTRLALDRISRGG